MDFLLTVGFLTFIVVLCASSMRRYESETAKSIYFTILPFAWVLHLGFGIYSMSGMSMLGPIVGAVYFVCAGLWYLVWKRDKDKDDRWKKWRKSATEKVSVLNGRLVTVSAR